MQMRQWSITPHGPSGIIKTVDTGESQFVIGTEIASDVFTIQGEGIMPRHAWVWISEARQLSFFFLGETPTHRVWVVCPDCLKSAPLRGSVRKPRAIRSEWRFRGVAQVALDRQSRPMPLESPPDRSYA